MNLILPLKGVYFDAIAAGTKLEENRLCTDYWKRRLIGRSYENIILTRGYPRKDDQSRRIVCKWNGYKIKTITHEHFGPDPVEVFAIDVSVKGGAA